MHVHYAKGLLITWSGRAFLCSGIEAFLVDWERSVSLRVPVRNGARGEGRGLIGRTVRETHVCKECEEG